MRYLVTLALFIIYAAIAFAQPQIRFENKQHDFGSIKEDGGPATTVFEFTNTGNQPLIVNNVKATCGCTTPSWTKDPIAPNQKGAITVTYDPKSRVGAFSKNVNVYSNTQPSVNIITIKGKVEEREKTIDELYPRVMGPIRLKSNYISFGSMVNTQTKVESIELINTSDQPAKLGLYRSPEHIGVKLVPEIVEPGKTGKIDITYDALKKNAFGYINERIYLTINGEKLNTYSIGVSVTLNEDFSGLSAEELSNAPVTSFDEKVHDFGNITLGEKVTHVYKLSNNGKRDLLIRNVKPSCGCTAVKHSNNVRPGETIDLVVEFNSKGKRGRQNKTITVITNDPKNPSTLLRLMGNVTVDE